MAADSASQRQWGVPEEGSVPDTDTMYPAAPVAEGDGVVPIGEAWESIAAVAPEAAAVAPFRMLEDVPPDLRQAWANAWVFALSRVREAMEASDDRRTDLALR